MIELAGTLIVREGEILLLYSKDEEHWEAQCSPEGEDCSSSSRSGCWDLAGGKVEEDESPTEAAVREAEEEIGIEPELEKPFYSGEFQHNGKLFLWHCYLANIGDQEPGIKEDRFEKLEWFKGSELDGLELAPNLDMILPSLRRIE